MFVCLVNRGNSKITVTPRRVLTFLGDVIEPSVPGHSDHMSLICKERPRRWQVHSNILTKYNSPTPPNSPRRNTILQRLIHTLWISFWRIGIDSHIWVTLIKDIGVLLHVFHGFSGFSWEIYKMSSVQPFWQSANNGIRLFNGMAWNVWLISYLLYILLSYMIGIGQGHLWELVTVVCRCTNKANYGCHLACRGPRIQR